MTKIGKSALKKRASAGLKPPTKKELEAMAMARAIVEQEKQRKKQSSPYTYQRPLTSTERAEQFVEDSSLGESIRERQELKDFARSQGLSLTMAERRLELERRKRKG